VEVGVKLVSSLTLNAAALWACAGPARATGIETFRRGFELCVVARDANEPGVCHASSRSGRTLLVTLPALLSSSDVQRAMAVTKSSWYVLSGSHRTSTLRLKLKPERLRRAEMAFDRVVGLGEQVALLIDGEAVGILVFQHPPQGNEIVIDSSFFSDGTEKEKELETRRLAAQINSTLY